MTPRSPKMRPELDPSFSPFVLWEREYRAAVTAEKKSEDITLSVLRAGVSAETMHAQVFPHEDIRAAANERAVRGWAKSLLWRVGGESVSVVGPPALEEFVTKLYSPGGERAFDAEFFSGIYEGARPRMPGRVLGGNQKGCRIGFDLGASDRKCAAVNNGAVVFSEEVIWNPAVFSNPAQHIKEIRDMIGRAAAKLPCVDAIGGSTAGIVVDGEVREATLFRGISKELRSGIRSLFNDALLQWKNLPRAILNDGTVAALAGAQTLGRRPVLGLALGSSLAAGWVDREGKVQDSIDELAFIPIDMQGNAPIDPWSKDRGCAAQYLSQQGVARLAHAAEIAFESEMSLPERLVRVQELMEDGDVKARKVYESLGVYLGYALGQYDQYYDLETVLLLGRVMSGAGGNVLIKMAEKVLAREFPERAPSIKLRTVGEREKRHGQAVAAASLPPDKEDGR